jgi:hypothetical protein
MIGKACAWFHCLVLTFKGFRIMFVFNLNVVFTLNFLKMALSRVHFSPGFPRESYLLQRVSRTLEELLYGASFPRRLLQRSSESGEECSGRVLEPQWPTWSSVMRLLPGKYCSWGKSCTRLSVIFKQFSVNTTFVFKKNLIRNNLNLSSIEPNHQKSSPNSWATLTNIICINIH